MQNEQLAIKPKYKKNISIYIIVLLFILFPKIGKTKNLDSALTYSNTIFDSKIKNMRTYILGNQLSYPVIELNGENKILFEFDLLGNFAKNYAYQIIHCKPNWQSSQLFTQNYMDGFDENTIFDYSFSENTKQAYVHYQITLPNEDVVLKVSGNYAIRIFEPQNPQKTIATARFSVYEPKTNVLAKIVRPITTQFANKGQEIRFSIHHENLKITDPFSEIEVYIYQNNRPHKILKDLKPNFVKNNELIYNFSGENIFLGGNEFRIFSTTGLRIPGNHIQQIKFIDTLYHIKLRTDQRRSYKKYFWEEDTNGRFVIFSQNKTNHNVEADYTLNHFSLFYEQALFDSKIYVTGGFCNWNILPENELKYNFDKKMYQAKILMKQGIYNYSYITVNNYNKATNEEIIEGNHYQTENNYLIFVYFKEISDNFYKLIGFQIVNSKFN